MTSKSNNTNHQGNNQPKVKPNSKPLTHTTLIPTRGGRRGGVPTSATVSAPTCGGHQRLRQRRLGLQVIRLAVVDHRLPVLGGSHLPHVGRVPSLLRNGDDGVDRHNAASLIRGEVPRFKGEGFDFVDALVGSEVVAVEGSAAGGGGERNESLRADHAATRQVESPGDPPGGFGWLRGERDGEGAVGGVVGVVEDGAEGGEGGAVGVGPVGRKLKGGAGEGRMGRSEKERKEK